MTSSRERYPNSGYSKSNRLKHLVLLGPLLAASASIFVMVGSSGCAGYNTSSGVTPPSQQRSAAILSAAPGASFGNVSVGSSAKQSLIIKNTGTKVANISAATVSGVGFSVVGTGLLT